MDRRGLRVVPYTPKTFFYEPDGTGTQITFYEKLIHQGETSMLYMEAVDQFTKDQEVALLRQVGFDEFINTF